MLTRRVARQQARREHARRLVVFEGAPLQGGRPAQLQVCAPQHPEWRGECGIIQVCVHCRMHMWCFCGQACCRRPWTAFVPGGTAKSGRHSSRKHW